MKFSKKTIAVIIAIIIYRLFMDMCYKTYIAPNFSYQKMVYEFDLMRYGVSWLALMCVLPFFVLNKNAVTGVLSFSLFVVGFVPLTSYYAFAGLSWHWLAMSVIFWVLVSIFARLRLPAINLRRPRNLFPLVSSVSVLAIVTLLAIILKFGFSFGLSFSDVYEVRAENTLNSIPLGGYIVPWAARIAIPTLVVVGLWIKGGAGKWMVISGVLLEFIFFSITGHKSFLFSIFAVVGFYWLAQRQDKIKWIAVAFAAGTGICYLADLFITDGYLSALIIRRGLYVPAMLSSAYYEFFQGRYMYLSHSILSAWIENPLGVSPSIAVGEQYLGFAGLNANNGVVADGYMNFGVIGLLIWAMLVGLTIAIFDAISRSVPMQIALPLGLIGILSFINTGFFTGLLTHGILFLFSLLMLVPSRMDKKYRYAE